MPTVLSIAFIFTFPGIFTSAQLSTLESSSLSRAPHNLHSLSLSRAPDSLYTLRRLVPDQISSDMAKAEISTGNPSRNID
ncbi:hypothetical protein PCANC_16518 [Puccinia coronata f. sp. avenae]|uniref:Secreted protein n=1 Tax=Puccinia coronata f. sp. avenae TaxID=200324 RepID=A0A2N5SRA0_9BASI|nr:hypothetical protein PCANC_16518 [Puccinia coronata f. sp. avenae]